MATKILFTFIRFEFIMAVAVCLAAAYFYVANKARLAFYLKIGASIFLAYLVSAAAAETYLQYRFWAANAFSKNLLPPAAPLKYFLSYSLVHFWLKPIFAIGLAFFFYLFLKLISHRREWLFSAGEEELGGLCALVAGWPGFVIFLSLVFIAALPLTLFRLLVLKQERTTLGAAFLLAAIVTLLFGNYLINKLGLEVLKI